MYTGTMVAESQSFLKFMADAGLRLRAAVWVYLQDSHMWRLWIVPPSFVSDRTELHRQMAGFFLKNRDAIRSFNVADIEMMPPTHPPLLALRKLVRFTGDKEVFVPQSRIGGVQLTKGIILRLEI